MPEATHRIEVRFEGLSPADTTERIEALITHAKHLHATGDDEVQYTRHASPGSQSPVVEWVEVFLCHGACIGFFMAIEHLVRSWEGGRPITIVLDGKKHVVKLPSIEVKEAVLDQIRRALGVDESAPSEETPES